MQKDTISYEAHGNLYLNITNRCSGDCVFCIRNFADGVYGYNLRLSREPSDEEIIRELEGLELSNYGEVVFTGFGEPTCRLDTVLNVTGWLHRRGIQVRLDTNGHAALLHPGRDVVAELKSAGLDALSVSLNAESEEKYNELCQPAFEGAYQALLDFTNNAVKAGIRTRMTIVGHTGVDIEKCRRIATELGVSFKVR
jgi:TatD family-associated radical SAM protein